MRALIKYLGSKRKFVGVLGAVIDAVGAETAADLFTGTTRVAQEFKRRGAKVWALDLARYSEVFAKCYIELSPRDIDRAALSEILADLDATPGRPGYFTRTFCEEARFLAPANGARVDAIRDRIEAEFAGTPLYPVLLTSLILAADRVDSTTGLQMAYLKQWAERAKKPLELRAPDMVEGPSGVAIRGDIRATVEDVPPVDVAYLDPPYNQHSYAGNYHVWDTLVAWDAPEAYGVARKRVDVRGNPSPFNRKGAIAEALAQVVRDVKARLVVISYNDESYLSLGDLRDMCSGREAVRAVAFDYKRYVGAQIGIYNPAGLKTGEVGHLRNLEYLVLAGDRDRVEAALAAVVECSPERYGRPAIAVDLPLNRHVSSMS